MWKWFILLWLAQWRTLLSQPVISENVRESRQLNFAECCPCHESQRSADYDVMEAASTLDSCPCQSASDSESAPSTFTPSVRAVEPFMRSGEVRTPKPLLKPEVGLASSVLETLQEVTDQEYQEALVRDATRTALNDREENLLEEEITNTPRNIVNIIMQPKDGHTLDDVMPEASHIQETRCVHPPLGRANSFDQMSYKRRNNVLGRVLPSSSVKSGKTFFDMTNSASNIQENEVPMKNNILEDLKLKSDLLKTKLFSNNKNSLKDTFSSSNKLNPFEKLSQNENSNDGYDKRIPNYKLGSLLEYLKNAKQKNNSPTAMKENDKKAEDVSFSPSNIQNHYLRNNEKIHYLPKSFKSLNEEDLIKDNLNSKEKYLNDKFIETQQDVISEKGSLWNPPSNTNLEKSNNVIIKNSKKNDCEVNHSEDHNLKGTKYSESVENIDAESSPTELKTDTVEKPVDEIGAKDNYFNDDWKNAKHISTPFNNNIQEQAIIKETVPRNYDVSEIKDKNEITANNVETDKLGNETNDGHSCDADVAASSDVIEITNVPQTKDKINSVDNDNDIGIHDKQLLNTLTLTTTEKSFDIFKTNDIFPNIKADVLKTLDKIKNANGKIQDKLRLNAQNRPKLDVINKSSTDIESNTLKVPKNDDDENNNNMRNNINTQDLQEMSDRILNLSLSNEKSVEPLVLDASVSINNITDVIKNIDSEMSPSDLTEIKEPSVSSSDSLLKSSDEIVDKADTFNEVDNNQNIVNNDAIDSVSRKDPCESMTPKLSDNTEVSSSNNQEKEMMTQASSPFENRIRHTNQDFIVQPQSNLNVKSFLENLKSSISDILNNNENINSNKDNCNDNTNINSIYSEKNEQNDLNKSPFNLNEPKNIDTVKNHAQTRTQSDLWNWDKNNHQINRLNSYKAKVASPNSLNLKTVPVQLNKNQDTLQRPFQDDPEVRSASTIFQYPLEKPSSTNLKIPTKIGKKHSDSGFNLQKSQKLQDILPSTESLHSLSENFKSRTEDAFRNIKDSIDDFKRSHITNQKNLLGESYTPQNIFLTTSRPNNIDKRLQDFHSDLKDRLSQMSQRIPDIFDDNTDLHGKYKINNLNNKIKSNPKYKHQIKNLDLPKSKINLALKPHTSQSFLGSSKKGTSNSNVRQFEDPLQLGHKFDPKTPLRKENRRKPLKENKVTFSFTTPRTEITKLRPNQKIYNKLTPDTLRSLIKLPKSPYKSPLQKSLELKSKFKPDELKHSASNQFTSHIAPDMKLGNPKTAFSSLEESMISPSVSDLCDENTNPKISDFSLKSDPVLSKMKDSGKGKDISPYGNLNKKLLYNSSNNLKPIALPDAKPSASNNNINTATSTFADRSLKENVSYKCKMICFEDNEDFK